MATKSIEAQAEPKETQAEPQAAPKPLSVTSPIAPRPLLANRVKLLEAAHRTWAAQVPAGVPIERLRSDPKYWSSVAENLKPGDVIEVRWDDDSGFARFFVRLCTRTWAKLALLEHHAFEGAAEGPPGSSDHIVKYLGSHLKWAVIRLKDEQVVSPNPLESRLEAEQWLATHEGVLRS